MRRSFLALTFIAGLGFLGSFFPAAAGAEDDVAPGATASSAASSAAQNNPAPKVKKPAPVSHAVTTPVHEVVVHLRNFAFVPAALRVKPGTKVTFVNDDAAVHSAAAADKSFDSGDISQGSAWSHIFDKPGTYDVICDEHSFMTETVTVR
jgi:plastocyanin